MIKLWLVLGSVAMFLGVALGAFGAHGLKDVLSQEMKAVYQTAVSYHLIHGLALLWAALAMTKYPQASLAFAAGAFFVGIILFSGSLYALSITGISRLGMITPFGGLAFLVGWGAIAFSAFKI